MTKQYGRLCLKNYPFATSIHAETLRMTIQMLVLPLHDCCSYTCVCSSSILLVHFAALAQLQIVPHERIRPTWAFLSFLRLNHCDAFILWAKLSSLSKKFLKEGTDQWPSRASIPRKIPISNSNTCRRPEVIQPWQVSSTVLKEEVNVPSYNYIHASSARIPSSPLFFFLLNMSLKFLKMVIFRIFNVNPYIQVNYTNLIQNNNNNNTSCPFTQFICSRFVSVEVCCIKERASRWPIMVLTWIHPWGDLIEKVQYL